MGNCQAAEAATVMIHHPAENKVERIYRSVTASEVMRWNPGHYVAVVVTSSKMRNEKGSPLKQLKLVRPDDTLHIGHLYRLVSFQDVLNDFATKKCVNLLKEGEGLEMKRTKKKTMKKKTMKKKTDQKPGRVNNNSDPSEDVANVTVAGEDGLMRWSHGGGGGWRPALHSIPECRSS